jgi:hypothetical protein
VIETRGFHKPCPSDEEEEAPREREYVGIDVHRRRSVIYRMDQAGERFDCVGVANEPGTFAEAVSAAPVGSDVVIEATYGWYWAADLLAELGYREPPRVLWRLWGALGSVESAGWIHAAVVG